MKRISLRCCWQGHEVHLYSGFPGECLHCGKLCDPDECIGWKDRLRFWWRYQRPAILRPRFFLSRCPDCGKRFNQHTDECPPF